MTHIFRPDPREAQKWRNQAGQAAAHLKKQANLKSTLKIAFAFDDGIAFVTISADAIRQMLEAELADHIYKLVLEAAQAKGSA